MNREKQRVRDQEQLDGKWRQVKWCHQQVIRKKIISRVINSQ